MNQLRKAVAGALVLMAVAGCGPSNPRSEPTPTSSVPGQFASAAPRSVVPTVAADEYTQTLVRFLDARVEGSGAETFLCCDAKERAAFEPKRLYSYGGFDLLGYIVTEKNKGLPASGGHPWFIVSLLYEDGVLEESGSASNDVPEFIVVGPDDTEALRVTIWRDEGTS